MELIEAVRYRDEFYPVGFRKLFALMLVVAVTVLPEVFSWVGTPVQQPGLGMPRGDLGARSRFLSEPEAEGTGLLATLGRILWRTFVVLVATFGLILYYPRSGFKRYALLCGPLIAFLVPACVAQYLEGRTEVFRAEVLVVTLLALAPGVGLYIWLTWRKAKRLGMVW
jgi:hypothetical protein